METPVEVLKKYWGYESFRHPQAQIIDAVLANKDTLAILPTGGGKSLCFQVPAILLGGVTLVISPLIALMTDQVDQLKKRNIHALALHSNISKDVQETLLSQTHHLPYSIVYISPEKLASQWFQERILGLKVNLVAIDEAHCISQWGYDFRPEYQKIKASLVLVKCPIIALTASATPIVQQDIKEKLKLTKPQFFTVSTFRPNLRYQVFSSDDKGNILIRKLSNLSGSSIVYLKTRKMCHELSDICTKNGITHHIYHAGLPKDQRAKNQKAWIKDEVQLMLATNAFGMGIDKPNVRSVFHYGAPNTLEAYYQEAGRAGRDGEQADVILINGAKDKKVALNILNRSFPSIEVIKTVFQALCDTLQVAEGYYSEELRLVNIDGLKARTYLEFMDIHYALKILDLSQILSYDPEVFNPSKLQIVVQPAALFQLYEDNQTFENIIKAIIRIYGASIYNEQIRINESSVARMSETNSAKVIEILEYLKMNGIIHYFKGTDQPVVQFLIPRPQTKNLPLNHTLIKFLKERALQSIEDMYDFVETTQCKQQYIASYFGTELEKPCGKCSSCETKDVNLERKLLDFLKKSKKVDLENIKQHFSTESNWQIAQVLDQMINENTIHRNKQGHFEIEK